MRSHLFTLLLVSLAFFASPAGARVEIYSDKNHYLVGDARKIELNVGFGEVQIEGTEGSEVGIEFSLTCGRQDLDKCRRRGERIRVVPRIRKGKFVIGLRHTPQGKVQGLKAHIKLAIPRNVPLDVDMLGGDVFVTRMLSDVAIAGGGGDVDVVAAHEVTGDVNVNVVAGKAELWMGDGHLKGGGWPRSIRWRGPGHSRIKIELGTGDARVRLE